MLINDEKFIEQAEIIWEKGTNRKQFFRDEVDKYTWVDIGSSFLPSELVGAFLYAQLEHAEKIIKRESQYELREPQSVYNGNFDPENSLLRAENGYFWDVVP